MKKTIQEQVLRQLELMKYNIRNPKHIFESTTSTEKESSVESGPGLPITHWTALFFKKTADAASNFASTGFRKDMESLWTRLKDTPEFKPYRDKGINTFDDMIMDMKNINFVSNGVAKYKLTDLEYQTVCRKMIKDVLNNPLSKNFGEAIYQEYRSVIRNRNQNDLTFLDDLEYYATQGMRQEFDDLRAQMLIGNDGKPILDPDIIKYIELSKFKNFKKTDLLDGENWLDGFYKQFTKLPRAIGGSLVDFYKSFIKNTKTEMDVYIRDLHNEYINVCREWSTDLEKGVSVNYQQYIRRINEISLKLSKYENDTISNIWKEIKNDLPSNLRSKFDKADGTVDYANFKQWIKYFDEVEGGIGTYKPTVPRQFVTRLDALMNIFRNPPTAIQGKQLSRWSNFILRVGMFFRRGTFRIPEEIRLNRMLIGTGRYQGVQVGELLMSYLVYMPLASAVGKSLLQVTEFNNPGLTSWAPPIDDSIDGEILGSNVKEEEKIGTGWFTLILKNWGDRYTSQFFSEETGLAEKSLNISWALSESISPGGAYLLTILSNMKTGGKVTPDNKVEIEKGIKQLEVDSVNIKRELLENPQASAVLGDPNNTALIDTNANYNIDNLIQDLNK